MVLLPRPPQLCEHPSPAGAGFETSTRSAHYMEIGIGIGIAIGFVVGALVFGRGRSGSTKSPGGSDVDSRIRAAGEAERQVALREAIGRVSSYLDSRVREPLDVGPARPPVRELRARMDQALGALSDIDFFLEETPSERQGADLVPLVTQVAKEFSLDHNIGLRLEAGSSPVRASVNHNVLMDALYLLMHNAERFGGGATIEVAIAGTDGRATVLIRDGGEGFSEEAFKRAFDPFYSTSSEGLGLGLPHARGLVEGMGGRIELRNVPGGGAEVEVSFPTL